MNKLNNFFNSLLDYFWPQFCLNCRREGSLCCTDCLAKLELLPIDYHPWPEQINFSFDHCYVCLSYSDPLIEKLIKNFKYHYLKNLSFILADILTRQIARLNLPEAIITNIPLHIRKKKKRGFDQTEILAKLVAKNLNWPYQPLLKRIKNTATQAELAKADRKENVQNAFALNTDYDLKNKTIILIDDVATTGSTLNEAARILKIKQPNKILAIVLAKN